LTAISDDKRKFAVKDMKKNTILITNDDGIHSPGLELVRKSLESMGDVWVVAPQSSRSTCSHSMSLHKPIMCRQIDSKSFAMDGTPSDCVFIALYDILPEEPAFVISGVNDGLNLGKDTFYSGTVAGAREASFKGIPSASISIDKGANPLSIMLVVRKVALTLLNFRKRYGKTSLLLNVNIPGKNPKGVMITRLGPREYHDKVIKRKSPRNETYYWINGGPRKVESGPGTDGYAISKGYVSVTPLLLDLTDLNLLYKVRKIKIFDELKKLSFGDSK